MNKINKYILIASVSSLSVSCDIMQEVVNASNEIVMNMPSESVDIAAGLKAALNRGTGTAVAQLHKTDGFFKDELIKIYLPEEAKFIYDNKDHYLLKSTGISKQIDDVILSMNRVAEEASAKAAPIFTDAVSQITFADAEAILFGEDNAATVYLKNKSYNKLYSEFKPDVDLVMNKDLGLGFSANSSWTLLADKYNKAVDMGGSMLGWKKTNTDLSKHVTEKALDGVFVKIEDEEKLIRKDPKERVTQILKDVFGKLDNQSNNSNN
ncbi:MAG: DUF4197 domain-containing protein [Bacteroidota bacterium]